MRKTMKKRIAVLLAVLMIISSVGGFSASAETPSEQTYYIVTYILNGEEYGTAQAYLYGAEIVFPPLTVPTGYAFSGWSDTDGYVYTQEDVVLDNLVLYGSLTHTVYELNYVVDGAHYGKQNYHYEDTIDYLVYPEQMGYTFSGWFADENGEEAAPATMPDGNLTVYGTQTHDFYTVSYWLNGVDTGIRQTDYHYGDDIVPITSYDNMEGMTFSGWFTDSALTQPVPETMPAENIVLYGKQEPKEYVLTYKLNGYYHSAQTYKFGEAIRYLEHIEQEGYTFEGWTAEGGAYAPLYMPAHDVTVYGELKEIAVSRFNGGKKENVTVGDTVDVVISLDAPYLNGVQIYDIDFDSDVMRLVSMQLLSESGEGAVDLGNRTATLTLAENTDLDGDFLKLTFEVYANAAVGLQEITFEAEVTSDMGAGSVKIPVQITPAVVQVICATHSFEGGQVVPNNNSTHLLYCTNGCGVSRSADCSGGTATCLQKAVCAVCEAPYGQKASHDYSGATRSNGDGTHSYRCINGCGEYGTKINCTYGVAQNNGDNATHKIICEYCGYSADENCYGGTFTCLAVGECERCKTVYGTVLAHSYTGAIRNRNDGTHDYLCVNGCNEYGNVSECNYTYENKSAGIHGKVCTECDYTIDEYCEGLATCLAPAVCSFCETSFGTALQHDFSGTGKDNGDGTHSLQCRNGCEQYGEPVSHTAGEYKSNADGTHTATCTQCNVPLNGTCSGGTATCLAFAVCTVCKGEYGTKPDHDYSGAYTPNGDDTHSRLCVNGCEQAGGEKEECSYGDWVGDGVSKHTKTCTVCGGTKTENCTGGTATCTQKAVCEVCTSAYGELLPHSYPDGELGSPKSKENGTHTRYCTACRQDVVLDCTYEYTANHNGTHFAKCSACNHKLDKQPCSGGKATCEQQAICTGCKEGYGEILPHSYSGQAKYNEDNATHSLMCVNGCGKYGTEKIPCTPDGFVSGGDNTHHATCTQCKGTLKQNCSGGTATCEKKAVCAVCKKEYGNGGAHRYTVAKHDDTHHWWNCAGCDAQTQKTEHQFSAWTVESVASPTQAGVRWRFCYQCGVTFTEIIPREVNYGDVDMNGEVAVSDARTVLRASVGLETLSDTAKVLADVNKDSAVEVGDARLILRAAVGLENAADWGKVGVDNNGKIVK